MKVLEIIETIDNEKNSGIAKIITNLTSNIKDVEFDFLTSNNINDKWFNLGVSRKSFIGKMKYNHRLSIFLKKNKYDVVHINSGVFLFSFQVAVISKFRGVKKIISHSHSVPNYSLLKRIIKKVLCPIFRKIVDVKLACSKKAALSLFNTTKNVIYINNGVDIDKFKFDEKKRIKYRKELKIDDKKVFGHVGLFIKQKNHLFLLELFKEISKKEDAVLILLGTGPLEDEIKNKIKELELVDKVILLGYKSNVNELLNAMDYFIFPSVSEGLGTAVIEAETNGLITFVSDSVPKEVNISPYYNLFSLNDSKEDLAKRILNTKTINRKNAYKYTKENGYDIKDSRNKLGEILK